jgi:hypothetical protein
MHPVFGIDTMMATLRILIQLTAIAIPTSTDTRITILMLTTNMRAVATILQKPLR